MVSKKSCLPATVEGRKQDTAFLKVSQRLMSRELVSMAPQSFDILQGVENSVPGIVGGKKFSLPIWKGQSDVIQIDSPCTLLSAGINQNTLQILSGGRVFDLFAASDKSSEGW